MTHISNRWKNFISRITANFPFLQKAMILISVIGPGIITANIDNDAGGVATYSVAGAETGLRLLWLILPISIALMLVQEMSARIGIVSGKGLADLIREKFGLKVTFYTFIFLIFADFCNTTAEFAGIAASSEIFGISKYLAVPICAVFVWLLIFKGDYKIIERIFLAGCLVYLAYIICGVMVAPPLMEVANALFVPNFNSITSTDFPIIIGLIGTTITPWMQFYIQSAVVEKGLKPENLGHSRIDILAGGFSMFIVIIFIIICCAGTIHQSGITINDAKDAAMALKPLAGEYSSILFAIGLFNASFFAAALLPLATSYYVCEGLGLESGVDKSFKEAPHFLTIFTTLIAASAFLVLIPHIKLFKILIWSQIINGVLIPIVLLYIIKIANDPDIMGEYVNSKLYNFFAYGILLLMTVTTILFLYFHFSN